MSNGDDKQGGKGKGKPGAPNVSDGSVPQSFLITCETIAKEEADKFFTNCEAGATVLEGVVTVEVRAHEKGHQHADLSATGTFTVDSSHNDMKNHWPQALAQAIAGCFGFVRLDTEAPHQSPASDVEPVEPA